MPADYREPGHKWHDLGDINDRLGRHDLGSICEDAEEREATKHFTWTLIHNPDALAMLSELTRRRDAYVAVRRRGGVNAGGPSALLARPYFAKPSREDGFYSELQCY